MCFEKTQRFMMATVIAVGAFLVYSGFTFGFAILGFVVVMTIIWGIVDFCPSLWMLEKVGMRSCYGNRS